MAKANGSKAKVNHSKLTIFTASMGSANCNYMLSNLTNLEEISQCEGS